MDENKLIELSENWETYIKETNLTQRADEIINQDTYTEDDIRELNKIKREMIKLYAHAMNMGTCWEHNFEIIENDLSKYEGLWVTAQKVEAKLQAEKMYWNYRNLKAMAEWIKAKAKAIESICIQRNVTQKAMRDASMTQDDY